MYRPLYTEYMAIARALQGDHYLKMTEDTFVQSVKRFTYGQVSENRIRQVYRQLMKEVT